MDKKWYLLYVKEKKELRVATLLNTKGIQNYWPFCERESGGIFRTRIYQEPVLPGYLFARASDADFRTIREVPYVISRVHWKNKPIEIPEDYVKALKSFCRKYHNITAKRYPINTETDRDIKRINRNKTSEIILPEIGFRFIARDMLPEKDHWVVLMKQNEKKDLISYTG